MTWKVCADRVEGSPFQPGDQVRIVAAIDRDIYDVSARIGLEGSVSRLVFGIGIGDVFPSRPSLLVYLDTRAFEDFWPEELQLKKGATDANL